MNLKKINKNHYLMIAFFTIVSSVLSGFLLGELGIKDTVMFFIGTVLLLIEIYLIVVDVKLSVLLFIISFPIIVTARKVCNFDFLFFRITYETIYITVLFIYNFKNILYASKYYIKEKDNLKVNFILIIFAFTVFSYNSSIFSSSSYLSFTEIYSSVITPIFFMFVVITIFNKNDLKKISYSLIVSINLSCIYGFLQLFLYNIPVNAIRSNREFLTFGYHNINIFANILMMILPFLFQIVLYENQTIKEKIFTGFSLVLNMTALFLTYTRGAWLSFILAIFLILLSKKYRKTIYVLLIAFIAIAKPLLTYILNRGTSTSFLANESTIARIQSIFTSFKIMINYPFGTGAGTFASMYKKYMESGYFLMPESLRRKINVANYALEHAHNLWLQIGVELGIISLILFLLLIINRIKAVMQNYNENRAAFVALAMFLVFSVLTGFEFNHKGVITNNLILWLIFAIIEINNRNQIEENNS